MLASKRKKMCWNCDGTVSYDASFCPYCGSDLARNVDHKPLETAAKHKKFEENLASLYKPPYSGRSRDVTSDAQHPRVDEFSTNQIFQGTEEIEPTQAMTDADVGIWPLLFLSLGGLLLTLGLLLFFFSENGKVVLEWNAHYWFLYCLIATPLLMMGWRFLNHSH